jgi:hypothetical protein
MSFLPPFSDGADELQGWIFLRASSPRPTQLLLFRSAPHLSFAADGGGCQSQEKVDASSRKTVVIMLISKRMDCLTQPVIEGCAC